jgi:MFS family permease
MKFLHGWRGLQGLPRAVWALCLATLINRCGTMVLPFLVLYLTESRGFSVRRAGAALAVYGLGSMLVQPLAGKLTDRVGAPASPRSLAVLVGDALAPARHPAPLRSGPDRCLRLGVRQRSLRPAAFAFIGELVAPEKRKPAFALLRLAVNLGMSFGPAIGGFLATRSFLWLFRVDAATTFAAWLVMLRLAVTTPHTRAVAAAESHVKGWRASALGDPRLVYFVVALLPVAIVFFQHLGPMPLYVVRDLGLSTALLGLLGTLNTGIILLVEVPLNHSMAHWPHTRALALGSFLATAGFGALAVAHHAWSVAATVVVWTFGEMILFPASSAYVTDIAPAGRRGEYMGLYSLVFSVALTVGPWVGTTVLDAWGPGILWTGTFLAGCVSVALLARVRP